MTPVSYVILGLLHIARMSLYDLMKAFAAVKTTVMIPPIIMPRIVSSLMELVAGEWDMVRTLVASFFPQAG